MQEWNAAPLMEADGGGYKGDALGTSQVYALFMKYKVKSTNNKRSYRMTRSMMIKTVRFRNCWWKY